MASSYTWRALPLSPSESIPTLLVSIHLGTAAYAVRVTDTANIWVESLDRKQICMRAWGENTSIDPSDTPENMRKFLDSLRSALDPSHAQHAQTSMSLSPAAASADGNDGLTLNITCDLPGLSPLTWPVQLKKQAPSALANDLVFPLIQAQHARARDIHQLTEMLSQKDAIISKLLDKLESTGTGLEHVFNSLSSKKKVSRAAAESKVKGLAPFDRNSWQGDSTSAHHEPEDTAALLTDVFGSEGLDLGVAIETANTPDFDHWWHDLKKTVQIPHRALPSTSEQKPSGEPPASNTELEDEDEFQFQPSSPAAKPSKQGVKNQNLDDISTASESGEGEDEDKPTIRKTSAQPTGGRVGRKGGIGSRKQAEKQPSPPAPVKGKNMAAVEADGSDTATDASDEEEAPKPPTSPPGQAKGSVPSRGKIGRIGARGATLVSEAESGASRLSTEETPEVPKQSHAPKLGMIGKGPKKGSAADPDVDDERGRKAQTSAQAAEPSHRETSGERADRRREELKRELEKKAAAGPTKKKRKF